jgi:Wzt C-terminal domain
MNSFAGSRESDGHIVDLSKAQNRKSVVAPLLKRLEFYTDAERPLMEGLPIGARLKICIRFELPQPSESFNIGIGFNNALNQRIFTAHSCFEPNRPAGARVGPQVLYCDIPSLIFVPGDYTLRIWLDIGNSEADLIDDAACITVLESDFYGTGKAPWNGAIVLKHRWHLEQATADDGTANRLVASLEL